jgi:hypothetical protein
MTCRLRKITDDDLEMVMHWRSLPEVTKYMYTDPKLTPELQRQWFLRISASDRDAVWIIELLEGTNPVGLVSLSDIERAHRRCAWAYYFGKSSVKGTALAKTIECNIYDYVFDVLQFNKLWCEVFSFNDRVVALHERFGSRIEGVLRQHIWKNGQFHDVVRMGILRDEWHGLRSKFSYSRISIE